MSNATDELTPPSCFRGGTESNEAGLKPFFSTPWGHPTIATEGDLAQTLYEADRVSPEDFTEVDRYWAVYPYSYISICKSKNHGELRYFVVEPHLSETEKEVFSFIVDEVQSRIRNYDTTILSSDDTHRRAVIREAALELLDYYAYLPDDTIKRIHADGEIATDDYSVKPESGVERVIQRLLIGKVEEGGYQNRDRTRCRQHAISCGATGASDYLSVRSPLKGHPSVDASEFEYQSAEKDTSEKEEQAKSNGKNGDEEDSGGFLSNLPLIGRESNGEQDDAADVEAEPHAVESDKMEATPEEESSGLSSRIPLWGSKETAEADTPSEVDEFDTELGSAEQESSVGADDKDEVRSDGGTQRQQPAGEQSVESSAVSPTVDRFSDEDLFKDDPDYDPTLGLPPIEKRHEVREASASPEDKDSELTEYQIYKLLYYIEREFVGYKRIDAIKNDDQVEDISSSGYNRPVFVYHGEYENIRTNIQHDQEELDSFVTSLALLSGEELSRRNPSTDAKLPDGSRAELTYGYEISEHGSDYVIRQYKEVPHTPIDLINWETYSLKQMALLWLFVQYDRSILIAGKTGAGKTTTLNALSLFIPSNSKINTIEDTQELELPHENWQANTTRESGDLTDSSVEITMADLIQSALRKRPDRILVGEVRGDEAYNLFQSIRTGHPGITTFHAPTFEKMVRRMTSGEIDLAAEQLTALDLVLLQDEIRLEGGDKVRRNKAIYEVKGFAGGDDTDTQDMIERNMITKWNAQSDTQQIMSASSAQLSKVKEINGWDDTRHEAAIRKRLIVLSGLIVEEIQDYKSVAATIQAAIIDPDQVLESIAHQSLSEDIDRFGEDIVNIDVEHEGDEENVERPEPSDEIYTQAEELIEQSRTHGVLSRYV